MFSCKLYSYTYITYTFPATHLQDTLLICITAMNMLIMIVYFVINFKECMLTCGSWGAPNSNYLLVMVSTFVMPFSMDPLSPRMTPGCITQKEHECTRVLNTNQEAVPKHPHSYTYFWKVGNCMGKCIKCLDALHRIESCSNTASCTLIAT